MINKNIFKAYDIRGKYPKEINEAAVGEIIEALADFYKKGSVVLGHDARLSSPKLYREAVKKFRKFPKIKLIPAGLMTTPMLYFLVNYFKAEGGIMITASHNPPKYNGLKITRENAEPMSGVQVLRFVEKNE